MGTLELVPITFFPQTPIFTGPGHWIGVTTDFIGPIPIDAFWSVEILLPGFETSCVNWTQVVSTVGDQHSAVLTNYDNFFINIEGLSIAQGQSANMEIVLQTSTGTVLDSSASVPVTWDGAGQLATWEQHQPQASGGLTTQEHGWLDTVQQAVQAFFTATTGVLEATPIGSLITHPPKSVLNVVEPCQQLTGRGSLTPPGGFPFTQTYGLIVTFNDVPPGFGLRLGAADEFSERICQFVAIHNTADGTVGYFDEIKDVHVSSTVWTWETFAPSQILFDVTAGCTITICWLFA